MWFIWVPLASLFFCWKDKNAILFLKRLEFIMFVSCHILWRKSDLLENDKIISMWCLYFNMSLKINCDSLENIVIIGLWRLRLFFSPNFWRILLIYQIYTRSDGNFGNVFLISIYTEECIWRAFSADTETADVSVSESPFLEYELIFSRVKIPRSSTCLSGDCQLGLSGTHCWLSSHSRPLP